MSSTRGSGGRKLRALDLFCSAGGAAMGLHQAGFEVTGVDIEPQPEYPFKFIQGDALAFDARGFDLIWASPPCQFRTAYKRRPEHVRESPNFIPATQAKLRALNTHYIIENVEGAREFLHEPVKLCGSMFGLDVQRHRLFETTFACPQLPCDHSVWTPRFKPATNRANLRKTVEVGVWRIPLEVQRRAMGIDWMSLDRLSESIPPAYGKWLGEYGRAAILEDRRLGIRRGSK